MVVDTYVFINHYLLTEFHRSASVPWWHGNRRKLPPKVFPWMASTLVQSVPSLVCSPDSTPDSDYPSFTGARGIFLNRSAHATALITSFYGLALLLKIQPQLLSMALRAFQVPGYSSHPDAPSPRAPPHTPFCSSSSPETSPTAALSHLLLPKTGNTQCLSTLPGT